MTIPVLETMLFDRQFNITVYWYTAVIPIQSDTFDMVYISKYIPGLLNMKSIVYVNIADTVFYINKYCSGSLAVPINVVTP